jgi:hypothetical protein
MPFFLSYARTPTITPDFGAALAPDQRVQQFFAELYVNVSQLISLPVGVEPGFMDRTMRGGVRWTQELLQTLGTCQIIIPLLSPRYLTSEWCGMECHAFMQRTLQREGQSGSQNQECIIPLIWVPLQGGEPPEPLDAGIVFSPGSPDVERNYHADGVFGMLQQNQETEWKVVAWQLAKHIAHVYSNQYLEHKEFKLEDLRTIFGGGTHD